MPLTDFPHSDYFDSVEPLESALDKARIHFGGSLSLNTSLPSFLMWQNEFSHYLAVKKNTHFILAHYGKYVYLPIPPKPLTAEALGWAFEYMGRANGPGAGISRIEGLAETELRGLPPYPVRPTLIEYVYDRARVATLQGNSFRSQRALVNQLSRVEKILFRPYRASDLGACGELFEFWKSQRLPALRGQIGEKMILSAQKAHLRALLQGEGWGMSAWVVFLGNRLAAYILGAPLNGETFGVFLEVADLAAKGLSTYIFTTLCRQLEGYAYVNAGDAEGLPHLAESKMHWHPIRKLALYALNPL